MRTVKGAEERRGEILDAAEALFATKGFDGTSTGDILERVGIARGTLYYHFQSKEDILNGVIDRLIDRVIGQAAAIAADKRIPFMSRLPAIVLSLQMPREIDRDVKEQLHAPQNALMHQRVGQKLIAGVVPILEQWVQEGVEQGIFHTAFSTVALEMALTYACTMFDDENEQTPEQEQLRIQGLVFHLERMLGVEQGALSQAMMEIFRKSGES